MRVNFLIKYFLLPSLLFVGGCSRVVELIEQELVQECDRKINPIYWNNCIGNEIVKNGAEYEGRFMNGKWDGIGKLTWKNGDVYEGEWKEDKKEGQGKYTWKNGDIYQGEWANNDRNGEGTLTWKNGDIYQGEWVNDKRNGEGTFISSNGINSFGIWKDNKKLNEGDKEDALFESKKIDKGTNNYNPTGEKGDFDFDVDWNKFQ